MSKGMHAEPSLPRRLTNAGVHLVRDNDRPFERHLLPDVSEGPAGPIPRSMFESFWKKLPPALETRDGPSPQWNSVALFFNLPSQQRPPDYSQTTEEDVLNWLDQGIDPADPTISQFMQNYWHTLSQGHLCFGIETPRAVGGAPLVPTISSPNANPDDWGGIIRACVDANAEAIWRAAGQLQEDGARRIPSLVLVQHYRTHASAGGGFERSVDGYTYVVDVVTHVQFSLRFVALPGVPGHRVREFWGILCHEYGHNFVRFGDLYGPEGCTGYWDLLGDNSPPGRMSEVCSRLKQAVGWIEFTSVISGPRYPARQMSLGPYTTTGEAFKVVPDPDHNPNEYFLLEYRKSTGDELWRPDRGLQEEGLLIIHINERLGLSGLWLLRDAPFFDRSLPISLTAAAPCGQGTTGLTESCFPMVQIVPSPVGPSPTATSTAAVRPGWRLRTSEWKETACGSGWAFADTQRSAGRSATKTVGSPADLRPTLGRKARRSFCATTSLRPCWFTAKPSGLLPDGRMTASVSGAWEPTIVRPSPIWTATVGTRSSSAPPIALGSSNGSKAGGAAQSFTTK